MPRFDLTAEQDELQRSARAFVERRLPVSHLRAIRDGAGADPARLSRPMWRELAKLGWPGIAIAEEHGGAGLGLVELGLVMEELGRTLAPTPMLATAVIGATAAGAAREPLRRALLPAIAGGDRLLALAFEEGRHFAPETCAATARRTDTGWRLDGAKAFVLDGAAADTFVVSARAGADLALFVVDRGAPGLTVEPRALVDSRSAAEVHLAGVEVADDAHLGGADLLDRLLARATAALCAEMLGGADAVFARTIEYLKTRHQFGVPIGSFQALKHRAAHMFCELELLRSVTRAALIAVETGAPDAALLVSAAKARASDTFLLVSAEAIQMHGGIGVTDDLDVGFYYKRATVAARTFGTAAYHRDRFATLQGY